MDEQSSGGLGPERALATIGILTALAVTASLIFDVGYFALIDLRLFGILSATDHLALSIVALPLMVFALALSVYLRARLPIRRRTGSEMSVQQKSNTDALVASIGFAVAAVAMAFGFKPVAIVYGFLFVLYISSAMVGMVAGEFSGHARTRILAFGYSSILIVMVAVLAGMQSAATDLASRTPTHVVEYAHGIIGPRDVNLLRTTSGGLLLKDEREIRFVPWQSVQTVIRRPAVQKSQSRPVCRWFGWCWGTDDE